MVVYVMCVWGGWIGVGIRYSLADSDSSRNLQGHGEGKRKCVPARKKYAYKTQDRIFCLLLRGLYIKFSLLFFWGGGRSVSERSTKKTADDMMANSLFLQLNYDSRWRQPFKFPFSPVFTLPKDSESPVLFCSVISPSWTDGAVRAEW